MPNVDIPGLPAVSTCLLTDEIPDQQGSVTGRATLNQVLSLFNSNIAISNTQVSGLGTASTENNSFFLQTANNLSDIINDAAARANLGLGSAAVENNSFFLQAANNLSDLASAATALTNLGLGSASSPTFADLTLSGVTASSLSWFNGSKQLSSVTLGSGLSLSGTGTLSATGAPGVLPATNVTGTTLTAVKNNYYLISGSLGCTITLPSKATTSLLDMFEVCTAPTNANTVAIFNCPANVNLMINGTSVNTMTIPYGSFVRMRVTYIDGLNDPNWTTEIYNGAAGSAMDSNGSLSYG